MVEILRAGGGARATDVALQTQRLTLDIVGLVAFSHDFRQAELTRRRAPPQPNPEDHKTLLVSKPVRQGVELQAASMCNISAHSCTLMLRGASSTELAGSAL